MPRRSGSSCRPREIKASPFPVNDSQWKTIVEESIRYAEDEPLAPPSSASSERNRITKQSQVVL